MSHEGLETIVSSRPLPLSRSTLRSLAAAAVLALLSLSACAGEPEADPPASETTVDARFPVDVTSCGHTSTLTEAPDQAVTLNQGATEVVLALGLEDQLAGTAYLDDAVPAKWKTAYDSVPVLSPEYPTREDLLALQPDFVYASYSSAYGAEVAGTLRSWTRRASRRTSRRSAAPTRHSGRLRRSTRFGTKCSRWPTRSGSPSAPKNCVPDKSNSSRRSPTRQSVTA